MRILKAKHVIVLLLIAAFPFNLMAQTDSSFGVGIGSETIDGVTYQVLNMNPELSFGKFGFGLDFDFRFTTTDPDSGNFSVYTPDWVLEFGDEVASMTKFQEYANLYLSKLDYVYWGYKGNPLYVRAGSIDSATLGNGFLMSNYANTRFKPERKNFGLEFDLDGSLFNFPFIGFESIAGNTILFDVIGGRIYSRPLSWMSGSVLSGMTFGFGLIMDNRPFYYHTWTDSDSDNLDDVTGLDVATVNDVLVGQVESETIDKSTYGEAITAMGIDFSWPLIAKEKFSMVMTADYGSIGVGLETGAKTGASGGFQGTFLKNFFYNAQIQYLGDDFVSNYFGAAYDLERTRRYMIATNDSATDPIFDARAGYLASTGFSFLKNQGIFLISIDGPFSVPELTGGETFNAGAPHVFSIFSIPEGTIPYVDFSMMYDKQSLSFDGLDTSSFSTAMSGIGAELMENALLEGKVNYRSGSVVLTLSVNVKYNQNPAEGEDPYSVTTGLNTSLEF